MPDTARATGLSVINALVTIYVGVGGVLLGELAEWSLAGMFTLLGIAIIAAAFLLRVTNEVTEPLT